MHAYGLWGTVPSVPSEYPHALPDSVGVPPQAGETVLVAPFNETAQAVAMIERHLPHLEKKNFAAIAKDLKQPVDEHCEEAKVLREVAPQPGRAYTAWEHDYTHPTVFTQQAG